MKTKLCACNLGHQGSVQAKVKGALRQSIPQAQGPPTECNTVPLESQIEVVVDCLPQIPRCSTSSPTQPRLLCLGAPSQAVRSFARSLLSRKLVCRNIVSVVREDCFHRLVANAQKKLACVLLVFALFISAWQARRRRKTARLWVA